MLTAATLLVAGVTLSACGGDDDSASDVGAASDAVTTTVADAPAETSSPSAVTEPAPISTMEPGDITATVPPQAQITAAPVAIDATTTTSGEVEISITSVESIETEAAAPGEIAGPGVALTVEFTNGSSEPLDLTSVLVDLVDANGLSATPINAGSVPLTGSLAAGESATGTYVFAIDEAVRSDVTIRISHSADEAIVLFTGDLA